MPDTHEGASAEALARRIAGGPPGSTDAEEAELYRRFAPRVRLAGRRHLRNDAAGDDLAQDVLLLTIERLRAGEVRQPEDIDRSFWGPADDGPLPTSGRAAAEALAMRFMETAVETAPSSVATLDAPRVGRACARSPSATGSSCCSRSTRNLKRLESRRISASLRRGPRDPA